MKRCQMYAAAHCAFERPVEHGLACEQRILTALDITLTVAVPAHNCKYTAKQYRCVGAIMLSPYAQRSRRIYPDKSNNRALTCWSASRARSAAAHFDDPSFCMSTCLIIAARSSCEGHLSTKPQACSWPVSEVRRPTAAKVRLTRQARTAEIASTSAAAHHTV
jgi:hypothetical protein